MKRKLAFGLTCLAFAGGLLAQNPDPSVVAAGGGIATGGQLQLEWTLGETAIAAAAAPNLLLTEGFHQPLLAVEEVASVPFETAEYPAVLPGAGGDLPHPAFTAVISPNPVASTLSLRFVGGENFDGARVELFSASGKTWLDQVLAQGEPQTLLQLGDLPPGIYFLRCGSLDGRSAQVFKVTKI